MGVLVRGARSTGVRTASQMDFSKGAVILSVPNHFAQVLEQSELTLGLGLRVRRPAEWTRNAVVWRAATKSRGGRSQSCSQVLPVVSA